MSLESLSMNETRTFIYLKRFVQRLYEPTPPRRQIQWLTLFRLGTLICVFQLALKLM